MRGLAVPILIGLVAFGTAAGAGFQDNVNSFKDAVSGRAESMAKDPSPTPEEQKEATGLGKALLTLGTWGNGTGSKDLGIVAKALGTVCKANSPDAGVTGSAGNLVDGYDTLASMAMSHADYARSLLLDPAGRAKVQAAMDKAEAVRGGYASESDWGKAAKILMKGIAAFGKAESLAFKYLDKETPSSAALHCSVTGKPAFSADPGQARAVRLADGSLTISGEMAGNPSYGIVLGVDGAVGPGTYPLLNAESWFFEDAGAGTVMSYRTSGDLVIEVITNRSVIGTFSFVSAGAVELTGGVFRLPIAK